MEDSRGKFPNHVDGWPKVSFYHVWNGLKRYTASKGIFVCQSDGIPKWNVMWQIHYPAWSSPAFEALCRALPVSYYYFVPFYANGTKSMSDVKYPSRKAVMACYSSNGRYDSGLAHQGLFVMAFCDTHVQCLEHSRCRSFKVYGNTPDLTPLDESDLM
jgi:hypothetical protein